MDSTTDKERNDHPKWPKDKGPAYLASFVFELATFMMRIGLAVFAHLTIEDMPESFPAGGPRAAEATEGTTTRVRSRQSMADFVAEYPDIDSEIKYKRASMKAYGYLEKGVREYPELREIIKAHFGNYVSSLKAIKVYVSGNTDKQLYTMRKVKYPALLADCKRRTDIPNLINQLNTLNFEVGTIDDTKKFADSDMRDDLLKLMERQDFELKDVHNRAFSDEPGLATWDGLCKHLNLIIRPDDTPPPHRSDRGTVLSVTSCFKCGAAGSSYHPSKRCTRSFSPCDKCDPNSDIRYTHSTNFHGMATNRMRKPPSVTCWRCGGAHLSNSCKVPCRCDTCGKDDHTTAYHDLYEQIKNRRAVGALDATARLQL
jgi:hypothetical protein